MIDPASLIVGALLFIVGAGTGERRRRAPKPPRRPELLCSCGHGYGTHEQGARCHGQEERPHYDGVGTRNGYEYAPVSVPLLRWARATPPHLVTRRARRRDTVIAWGIALSYLVIGLCVARLNSVWAYRKTVHHGGDEYGFWHLMVAFVLFWPLIAPVFGTYVLGKGVARFIKGPVIAERAKLNQLVTDREGWRKRFLDSGDPMNDAAAELIIVLDEQIIATRRKLGVRR